MYWLLWFVYVPWILCCVWGSCISIVKELKSWGVTPRCDKKNSSSCPRNPWASSSFSRGSMSTKILEHNLPNVTGWSHGECCQRAFRNGKGGPRYRWHSGLLRGRTVSSIHQSQRQISRECCFSLERSDFITSRWKRRPVNLPPIYTWARTHTHMHTHTHYIHIVLLTRFYRQRERENLKKQMEETISHMLWSCLRRTMLHSSPVLPHGATQAHAARKKNEKPAHNFTWGAFLIFCVHASFPSKG